MKNVITYLKTHKKIVVDFIYSIIAYALPTCALQFAVQPMVALNTSAQENGLFITLYSVVKLMVTVFIMPLANLRLLKKWNCDIKEGLNQFFNWVFVLVAVLSVVISSVVNGIYRSLQFEAADILLLAVFVLLVCIHDYYSIEFRVVLNYKKIVIDNLLIVVGYVLGILLFRQFGHWEYIFICGYVFGTIYVLFFSRLWRDGVSLTCQNGLVKEYAELGASAALNSSTVYCDKMLIYPVLGGHAVSVYNAAAIVSKAISIISSPARNVLLSYVVNSPDASISRRKIKRIIPWTVGGFAVIFVLFWLFSYLMCGWLYPKYAADATAYIPFITLAIMLETCAGIINILLLRFASAVIQTKISAIKLVAYISSVLILSVALPFKLHGFCIAILLAAIIHLLLVVYFLMKNISLKD